MPLGQQREKSPLRIASVGTVCGSGSGEGVVQPLTAPNQIRAVDARRRGPGIVSGPPAVPPGRL
jgi:hypothetical protein